MQRMAVLQEEKAADAGFLQSRTLRRMTITGQNRYNQLLPAALTSKRECDRLNSDRSDYFGTNYHR
ncbi:hypothetical protein CE91St54_06080 [Hungatella hathewayi]|uniref:Uncharacterized protein n=1 Tax=Hungatella hathewayi TaxID=154046 RepID=A0AA37JG90_9FIRM|nr:hypothetical protein CE91St55_06590 [Hungatella hathewayi]GKH05500.1 hypothetical protein CE91St54_06080 [Hungatella hathewayi]